MDTDTRSFASLSKKLDVQITQTDAHIEALTTAAKRLVSEADYEALSKQVPTQEAKPFTEADLIVELDKARVELLMDVQKQDYISEKLQEMITANDGIVRSVVDYYSDAEETRQWEEGANKARLDHYVDDIVGRRTTVLRENAAELEESYKKLAISAQRTLMAIQEGHEGLLSQQKELDEFVSVLNKAYTHIDKI